jgi:hypothetical protein
MAPKVSQEVYLTDNTTPQVKSSGTGAEQNKRTGQNLSLFKACLLNRNSSMLGSRQYHYTGEFSVGLQVAPGHRITSVFFFFRF